MHALKALLDLLEHDDPFLENGPDVARLRLEAMSDRFQAHRKSIPVLDRRAKDAGVDEIRSTADMVPLLFSHTTYKSYPEAFIRNGQWDRMTKWFTTLSAVEGAEVDLNGVSDIDEWLDRLADAGHFVVSSSGTSGKSSFMDSTADDIDLIGYIPHRLLGWPNRIPLANDRVVISLSRSVKGRYRGFYMHQARSKYFARPGETYNIEEPVQLSEMNRLAALRASIAAGTATPVDVQEFEGIRVAGDGRIREAIKRLAEIVIDKRTEPMLMVGVWPYAWQMVEQGRALGVTRAELHSDTVLGLGGGTKGIALPPDYREQILDWCAPGRQCDTYGMSEMSGYALKCESGVFHWPPWIELMMLDESGEVLLPSVGRVTGRVAMFDPVYSGRWGGLVTGDKATADFGRCQCGRPGPTVEDSVTRYGAGSAAGDDKLTCSGAVDAYVREAIT